MSHVSLSQLSEEHRHIVTEEQRLVDRLLAAAGPKGLPDRDSPYFAHMRLLSEGKQRDLLLGHETLISPQHEIRVIDWRTAPLAAVFFHCAEGETYKQTFDGRTLRGEVRLKRTLAFRDGALAEVSGGGVRLRLDDKGRWRAEAEPSLERLSAGPEGSKTFALDEHGRRIPDVSGLLDEQQQAIVQREPGRPLLVLGSAGCGKTTVALHRLVYLQRNLPRRYPPKTVAVVVPEPGLRRLTRAMLDRMGLREVGVHTFDGWIQIQGRRLFPDLPRRICHDTPAAAVRIKRHAALLEVLPDLVATIERDLAARVDRVLAGRGRYERRMLALQANNPLNRLNIFRKQLSGELVGPQRDLLEQLCQRESRRLHTVRSDLLRLFGDEPLMRRLVTLSDGAITNRAVDRMLQHTREQFRRTSDQRFADVDLDARTAVDGRGLDEGTPDEVARSLDIEDFAVCIELLRLKTGRTRTPRGKLRSHTHLVVDEAQELAPIELMALGRALPPGGTLTVCGDEVQQVDPEAGFVSFEQSMAALANRKSKTARLQTAYRSVAPIVTLAHEVLGPLAPPTAPQAVRDGPPVIISSHVDEAHACYDLVRALWSLSERQPDATVGVIAASRATARRLHAVINRAVEARLVLDGAFTFEPGIDVTEVSQVKGLEFDVVLVPDATAANYPNDPAARRRLHVAITRAIHSLWLLAPALPSPLLPKQGPPPSL